jgi:hypothetical protein
MLQNLSNGVDFGAKEDYMAALNPFLATKAKLMEEFFEQISVR